MKILVTGSNGQLGRELRLLAGGRDDYIFSDISALDGCETLNLDITDADKVREVVLRENIGVVINCAAYTDVTRAETDVEACMLLNATAPGILASVMKETGGLLVHVSTDYVFSGRDRAVPYTEDVACAPLNRYGLSKYEGERAVLQSGCRHIILRTSWLYSEFGRNFVKTMLEMTSSRPELKVVDDQRGTPTYALDLAEFIFEAVGNGVKQHEEGLYHFSDEGECTWYEFALSIAGYSGHESCAISPCTSGEFAGAVERPAYSVLDKSKIKEVFGISIPHWKDSLRNCLDNLI